MHSQFFMNMKYNSCVTWSRKFVFLWLILADGLSADTPILLGSKFGIDRSMIIWLDIVNMVLLPSQLKSKLFYVRVIQIWLNLLLFPLLIITFYLWLFRSKNINLAAFLWLTEKPQHRNVCSVTTRQKTSTAPNC